MNVISKIYQFLKASPISQRSATVSRYYALQRRNPNAVLKLPDTQSNIDIATNEPVVGGVYLRLFIGSPAWALRKPKDFLSELMDTTLTLMSKDKTDVSQIGRAHV